MKRFLKYFALAIVFTMIAFSSCKIEDEILDEITLNLPTETIEQEVVEGLVTVSGIIQGVVHDGSSSGVIDAVTVGYASAGSTGSVSASSTGGFSITELAPGDYILTFAKDGYTTVTANVTIPAYSGDEETVPEGGIWYVTCSVEPSLYPLTAGAKGFLFIDGYPAKDVTVQLDFSYQGMILPSLKISASKSDDSMFELSPSLYTTKVDSNGYFEFTNIPGTMAVLKVPSCNFMGYEVEDYFNSYMLSADAVTSVGVIELDSYDYVPIDIVEFNLDADGYFDPKNSLEITFNQTLDMDQSNFELWAYYSGAPVPVSVVESKALNTIQIIPQIELLVDTRYEIGYEVTTASGIYTYDYIDFWTIDGIDLISTNLRSYAGETPPFEDIPVTGPMTLTFSLEVDAEKTQMWMNNDDTGEPVELDVVIEGNTVSVTPVIELDYDTEYEMGGTVYSIYVNDMTGGTFSFYTEEEVDPMLEEAPGLAFHEDFVADDDTDEIPVVITAIEGAEWYKVYAKDNNKNSEWVLVRSIGLSKAMSLEIPDNWEGDYFLNTTIELPERFDYFDDDGRQTPFSHGTEVSLMVVGGNSDYQSPDSEAITAGDETPFSASDFSFSSQVDEMGSFVSADNSTGMEPVTFFITFYFGNGFYADETVDPTIQIMDGVSVATGVSSSLSWELMSGKYAGVVEITVEDGIDANGYTLTVNGVVDSSGNEQTEEALRNLTD